MGEQEAAAGVTRTCSVVSVWTPGGPVMVGWGPGDGGEGRQRGIHYLCHPHPGDGSPTPYWTKIEGY